MRRWIAATVVIAGCGVSPQPDPPTFDPPELDLDLVTVVGSHPAAVNLEPRVSGEAGSAEPGARLVVTDLDQRKIFRGVVADDGSFDVRTTANVDAEMRLDIARDDVFSDPVDVVVRSGGEAATPAAPDFPCLRFDPAIDLGAIEVGTTRAFVEVSNDCAFDVVIANLATIEDEPRAIVDIAGPATYAAGARGRIDVTVTTTAPQEIYATTLIMVNAPGEGRRALTIRGRAR